MEKQAITGGRSETGSGLGGQKDVSGNDLKDSGTSAEDLLEAETARKEALAESIKRKEQIDSLETENGKLAALGTSMTTARLTSSSN